MSNDISQYILIKVDRSRAKPLHDLTVEFHDRLFEDEALSHLLLHHGEYMEKRPKSYFNITDLVFHRTQVGLQLAVLQRGIELATKPHIVGVSEKGLEISLGFDAERVETLQRAWFEHSDVTTLLHRYEAALQRSYDEFNLQLVLSRMDQSRRYCLEPRDEERKLQERILVVWDDEVHNALDSAYYNKGKGRMRVAAVLQEQLSQFDFGRFFLLTGEEMQEGMKRVLGG